MKLFDLKGKVAIVTGGNGGIGLGMATGLAEAGADIVLAARNPEKAAIACATLRNIGRDAEFVPFDILSETSCVSMVAKAHERFGRIDILVNNAGASLGGAPESYSIADFKTVIDTSRHRRPRFRRSAPPPLRLTADDLTILCHVGEHRFLRSTHLARLLARSPEKIVRRLAALYHNGYLDRPVAQLDYFARAGSAPLVYALGNKAVSHFEVIDGVDPSNADWTDKNRDAGRPYIEHALLIADLMVGIECAVRAQPSIKLVSGAELLAKAPRFGSFGPVSWTMKATVPGESTEIAVAPDKVFALQFGDTGRRNYFFVEADRATMPIERRSLAQSSVKKKLLAYHHGHLAKRHTALWGIPGFRVLTITKSAERVASMIEVVKEITGGKGSNVFLFAEAEAIAGGNPLEIEWLTGKRTRVRLVE